MSQFDILLLAHFVGDYVLQTSWMATHKTNKFIALFTHSLLYTFIISSAAWFFFDGLSIISTILILCSHMILDQRTLVNWWLKNIMKTTGDPAKWLSIVVDQTFHLIILGIALTLSI